jgi:hypothetical protein
MEFLLILIGMRLVAVGKSYFLFCRLLNFLL